MTLRRIVAVAALGLVLVAAAVIVIAKSDEGRDDGEPSSVDVGFARDMIVHHQQAVLMAAYTREHAGSSEVRALAGVIDSAQQREIGQMTGWLQSWDESVASDRLPMSWMADGMPNHMNGMGVDSMPGMASPAEMDRLVNLTGRRLDIEFLRLMTRHHQGGLPMAKDAATRARKDYVRAAAQAMIVDQQREIDQMRVLLQAGDAAER